MWSYSTTRLVQHYGLTRDKLVCVALMTGSDYTEGAETVGPVTALVLSSEGGRVLVDRLDLVKEETNFVNEKLTTLQQLQGMRSVYGDNDNETFP